MLSLSATVLVHCLAMTTNPKHFAEVKGSPGEAARMTGVLRLLVPLMLILGLMGYLLGSAFPLPTTSPIILGLSFVLLAVGLVIALKVLLERFTHYIKGAHGEEKAARSLGFLLSDYTVYHSVHVQGNGQYPGEDLDHVVVSEKGLFVIETKNWRGQIGLDETDRITVDGLLPNRPPLEQAYNASRRLRDALHEHTGQIFNVVPLLCFVNQTPQLPSPEVSGVVVCGEGELVRRVINRSTDTVRSEDLKKIIGFLDQQVAG